MIQKQIVYLPIEDKSIDELMECKEGYFLTPEQLNEYTANVIKQALETAAENVKLKCEETIQFFKDMFEEELSEENKSRILRYCVLHVERMGGQRDF